MIRDGLRPLVAFDLLYKLISLTLITPMLAWFLRAVLRWSGDVAVSNFDLVSFFLSPPGLLFIAVTATVGFAVLFFELGGLVLISLGARQGKKISAVRTLQFLARRWRPLCELALRQFLVLGVITGVVIAVVALTRASLLSGGDIYFYLQVRPPVFWVAVALVGVAAVAAAIAGLVLLVRWIFCVPHLLLETKTSRQAMASSRMSVEESGVWRIVRAVALWTIWVILLLLLTGGFHALIETLLLWIAGTRINLVLAFAGFLLAIDFLMGILIGLIATVTFGSLVARLFSERRPDARVPAELEAGASDRGERMRLGSWILAGSALLVIASVAFGLSMMSRIGLDHTIEVTAHRGSARAAPENTLAAVRRAIEDGADSAEIDVQEAADGVVVLLHDTDLRRVAGVDRSVWEMTGSELQALDAGSWFSPDFAGEPIPTLDQVIQAAKGRIDLNIELKYNGHEQRLEEEVARLVRQADFADHSIMTSLELSGLEEVARLDAELRRGLIIAAQVGDPTRLDVDLLAVSAGTVSRQLIARAHRAGQEVHVWTVNAPDEMLTMIHLGVDNILTSTPDVLVQLQLERAKMTNVEKTLLYVADFLAGRL